MFMRLDRLYREQERLARRAVLYDKFGEIRHVAGVDCSYLDDRIIGGVVVVDFETLEPVEHAYAVRKLTFPYVPGLLAYREARGIVAAYKKIKTDVDIMMIDGFGTNHPRRCGIATHIGIRLDLPTIGVGKSFLCGDVKGDRIYQDSVMTGRLIRAIPEQKPVYVSPGHRVSLKSAVNIVKHCIKGYRQPEPTRLAHEYVTTIKNSLIKRK